MNSPASPTPAFPPEQIEAEALRIGKLMWELVDDWEWEGARTGNYGTRVQDDDWAGLMALAQDNLTRTAADHAALQERLERAMRVVEAAVKWQKYAPCDETWMQVANLDKAVREYLTASATGTKEGG